MPANQALRFPLPTDMPPDFYRAMEAGQPLELAAAPHLAGNPPDSPAQRAQQHDLPGGEAQRDGGGRGLAATAPPSPLGLAQRGGDGGGTPGQAQQQLATPATGGRSAAGHTPAASAGTAVQGPYLPPLVPVQLELASHPDGEGGRQDCSNGGGGEAIVVGRSFLRAHSGDVAGLLRLLCEQCEAPPCREVRCHPCPSLPMSAASAVATLPSATHSPPGLPSHECRFGYRNIARCPARFPRPAVPAHPQWDLLCRTCTGGALLRVPLGAAVQLEELLAGAHGLVLRERRPPGG